MMPFSDFSLDETETGVTFSMSDGIITGFSCDVFVKSAEDGTLKYVIPMHCDGTGKMYILMMNAWNDNNSFDFERIICV